jgi:CrcB protein
MLLLLVAAGSAAGGVLRYAVGVALQHRVLAVFPYGTLAVNVTGSLLAGFLVRYALQSPLGTPELRALLVTGFCGGYTTFSAFSFESVQLFQDGDYWRGTLNVLLNVLLSLGAALLGFLMAQELLALRRRF